MVISGSGLPRGHGETDGEICSQTGGAGEMEGGNCKCAEEDGH